jgi:uncharacterized protein
MVLDLLVIQPTPFCNINCDYCYLPARDDRRRMSMETLDAAFRRVFQSGLVAAELSVVWHAGEPLVLPPEWYAGAFAVIDGVRPKDIRVRHSVQTNATLINRDWCALIAAHDINVGLSIDGPAWLHDRHRKTRAGRGTHALAMRGLTQLRAAGIPFHVICVLTRESLAHPDALFDFFADAGVRHLCFNVEEIEGANPRSSMASPGIEAAFRRFFERVLERARAMPGGMRIREIDDVLSALRHPDFGQLSSNSQNTPFQIVTVAWDGRISTFSPELLGVQDDRYGAFAFGNVRTHALCDGAGEERFRRIAEDIAAGVDACRRACPYFAFCRGGAPANKLAENGTFACTETLYCRLTQKIVVECVLTALEHDLAVRQPPSSAAWA